MLDKDDDGQITHASEISFGSWSGKHEPFVSDLEGLRVYDSNGNGSLDRGDDAFDQFRIWKDADSDAVVDDGEMVGLEAMGFLAMSLSGYETGEKIQHGRNSIFATTDVAMAGGSTLKAADVFLSCDGRDHGAPRQDALVEAGWIDFGRASVLAEAPSHIV